MAKVICTLANASDLINGIKFVTHKKGMISEEISDEAAAKLARIKGYVLAGSEKADGSKAAATKDAKASADGAGAPKTDSENPHAESGAAGADGSKE